MSISGVGVLASDHEPSSEDQPVLAPVVVAAIEVLHGGAGSVEEAAVRHGVSPAQILEDRDLMGSLFGD